MRTTVTADRTIASQPAHTMLIRTDQGHRRPTSSPRGSPVGRPASPGRRSDTAGSGVRGPEENVTGHRTPPVCGRATTHHLRSYSDRGPGTAPACPVQGQPDQCRSARGQPRPRRWPPWLPKPPVTLGGLRLSPGVGVEGLGAAAAPAPALSALPAVPRGQAPGQARERRQPCALVRPARDSTSWSTIWSTRMPATERVTALHATA